MSRAERIGAALRGGSRRSELVTEARQLGDGQPFVSRQ